MAGAAKSKKLSDFYLLSSLNLSISSLRARILLAVAFPPSSMKIRLKIFEFVLGCARDEICRSFFYFFLPYVLPVLYCKEPTLSSVPTYDFWQFCHLILFCLSEVGTFLCNDNGTLSASAVMVLLISPKVLVFTLTSSNSFFWLWW